MQTMTASKKPTSLKKYGVPVVEGQLEAFCEQGMTHSIWAVYDTTYERPDGQRSMDGLIALEKGDMLTVFNDASRKEVLWQGEIEFDHTTLNGAGIQKGFEEQGDWIRMFMREYPAELVRAADVPKLEEARQTADNRHQTLRQYLKRGRG